MSALPRRDPPLVVHVPRPTTEPHLSSTQFGFRLPYPPRANVTTARAPPANLLDQTVSRAVLAPAVPPQVMQNGPRRTPDLAVHSEPTRQRPLRSASGSIDPRRAKANYDSYNLREGKPSHPNGLTGSHVAYLGPPEDMVGHDDEDNEDNHGDADREDEGEGGEEDCASFRSIQGGLDPEDMDDFHTDQQGGNF
jgi:hypothetical protein